ncbi:hypothetical protein ABZP36_029284 [Zizania latifolia]
MDRHLHGAQAPCSGHRGGEGGIEPARLRWAPRPEQILILESIFNSGMVNPAKDETARIRRLLERFGAVRDVNVFYWFQNRRSRSRRLARQLQQACGAAALQLPSAAGAAAASGSGGGYHHHDIGHNSSPFVMHNDGMSASAHMPSVAAVTAAASAHLLADDVDASGDDLFAISRQMGLMSRAGGGGGYYHHHHHDIGHNSSPFVMHNDGMSASAHMPSVAAVTAAASAPLLADDIDASGDDLFAISRQMELMSRAGGGSCGDHHYSSYADNDSTQLSYQSTGMTTIQVFINGVAYDVPSGGALDMASTFGRDAMLVHSSGEILPVDEHGVLLKGLQIRECYYLWSEEDASILVPGDIISIKLGDIVPADARLLEGDPLKIDQSALTGESLPVTKGPGASVYSGSTCKQGEIEAVVIATGVHTFFGKAAHLVDSTNQVGHFQKILALCNCSQDVRNKALAIIDKYAERGLRSLAIVRQLPEKSKDSTGSPWDLVGLLPLLDPPRHDSQETIKRALHLGVNVKMITGDQLSIAKETGRRLGMGTNMYPSSALLGQSKDESIASVPVDELIEKADGFAGVFPEHKYEIVKKLQEMKHICGMTGDGVNDAPALKRADIGIAVADATDAARSASDIVLTEPGLSVIISAVLTSRAIFQRMKNYTDRVKPSPHPDSWKLPEIFITGIVYGTYLAVMTVVFFWAMRSTDFFTVTSMINLHYPLADKDEMLSALYLQVSIISQALIFVTRSRSWSFVERPGLLLCGAFVGAQIIATLLTVYLNLGFAHMKGIGWGWAGVIWLYSAVTYIPLDLFKFAVRYALSGRAWDNLLEHKIAFTTKKDYGRGEREAQWATAQRTLHGLQTPEVADLLAQREEQLQGALGDSRAGQAASRGGQAAGAQHAQGTDGVHRQAQGARRRHGAAPLHRLI